MLKIFKNLLKTTPQVLDYFLYLHHLNLQFSSVLILLGNLDIGQADFWDCFFLNKANYVTLLFKMINYGVEGMISRRGASSVNIINLVCRYQ